MQNKTTLKRILQGCKSTLMILCLSIWCMSLNAQTISTAGGSNYLGNLSIGSPDPLNVSFVIQNTTGAAIALTGVSSQMGPFAGVSLAGDASITKLFVSSTSLSGVYDYSTPAWTQIGSGSAVVPAALAVVPVITGITYVIPAGAQLRFVLELSKGLRISSTLAGDPMPTPNVFSAAGFNLQLGNFQIAGQNVGFVGVAPTAPLANTPVFFGGSVTLSPVVACTGTPTPGNTVSSASSVCPATPFTLSVSTPAVPGTTGLTYQWQSSATGVAGSFANVAGAQSPTFTTTLSASTFYQVLVSCGANVGMSAPVQVNLNPVTSCYCAAGATNTSATFEKISNVTLNTINNTTTSSVGYENFTALSTSLTPGQPYALSVSVARPFAADQVIVWIDYNQNGLFTDPGETVYTSPAGFPVLAPATVSGFLIVPFTALSGSTRMRVRMHDTSIGANATSCGNSTYGQVEDYTVNILSVVPCTGTPTPGNTISSVPTVCGGTNFTLSLQNFSSGSGVTYQWQSSPTGAAGSYTNIAGATAVILTRSQTASTYYQAMVTCGANSATSTAIQVLLTPFTGCYCIPPPSDCSDGDRISNVTFGTTLNNSSACSANGYTSYRTLTPVTDIVQGAPNPMTVSVGNGGTEFVSVWIDYNQNAVFEASEFRLLGSGNGIAIAGTINIPGTALLGQTGMRVRVNFNVAQTGGQACSTSNFGFGETEDYVVNIVPCVPVAITTQPTSATIGCGGNATFSVGTSGSLPGYQWQFRTSSTGLWFTVPNSAPYGAVNTSSLTITNAPSSLNGYQYRAVVTGGCVGTDFSTPATLTVSPFALLITPGSGSVCSVGGTPVLLTVPNSTNVATFTNNTPGAIPDGDVTGISRTFNVTGITGGIINMRLIMNVTHPYASDVIFVLKAPNGNILNLSYAVGLTQAAGANFTNTAITSAVGAPALSSASAPWTGNFRPDARLTGPIPTGPTGFAANVASYPLLYSIPNGTWTLAMYDYGTPDVGSFQSATLEITYGAAPAAAVFTPTAGLFTDAAATVPYTGGAVTQVYALPTATTTFSATVSTATCTAAVQSIPITVRTLPSALSAVANKAICPLGTTTFTSTATGGANFTYQWKTAPAGSTTFTNVLNGGVYSGTTTATLTITGAPLSLNGNQYLVEASAASCTGTISSTAGILTVNPTPVVVLTANPLSAIYPGQTTTLTTAVSPNAAATYTWFRDGVVVAGATGNSLVVDVDKLGVYTVRVNDVNGCTATSAGITISAAANDLLFIYPSPNTGQFQVRFFSDPLSSAVPRIISVFDSRGARVYTKQYPITSSYTRLDVDLRNNPKGIYSVELTDSRGNRLKTGRVLVL